MTPIDVLHVVGARPNFMKVAPVHAALADKVNVRQTLVHTGQHYDANMSDLFFQQLGLPEPDINLGVGSASHTVQTARIMLELERILLERKPDLVLVYGDVNSTVSAALVCAKLLIPIGHVEAGLRSGDRTMPEEINRLITDQLADLLFTPSVDGNENLAHEGVSAQKIHFVGNVMIDTVIRLLAHTEGVQPNVSPPYALVTLHRPSNVDFLETLSCITNTLRAISRQIPVVFPVHPRTRQRLDEFNLSLQEDSRLHLLDPIGYVEFLNLQRHATVVITDSGGVQEETTFLGIPCLTVRENTERPVTVTLGTNKLVGKDMRLLVDEVNRILGGNARTGQIPPLWDGRASERIAHIISTL
jgi:UDP-N-acetylglucosamine 2-epimerase (non-hydrolysing)